VGASESLSTNEAESAENLMWDVGYEAKQGIYPRERKSVDNAAGAGFCGHNEQIG
jgi:hypothetical protein